jgi:hypothetical protein
MIGWGVYFDMGRVAQGPSARTGVFDWLVSRERPSFSFTQRWLRSFAGMSLRGLAWTAPAGSMLYYYGFGWQPMFSGVAMGLVYEIAQHVEADNSFYATGPPVGEFMWGVYIWFVLLVAVGTNDHRRAKLASSRRWARDRWARAGRYLLVAAAVCLNVVLWASVALYASVEQSDMRNQRESEAGLVVAAVGFLVPQLAFVALRLWLRASRSLPRSGSTSGPSTQVSHRSSFDASVGGGGATHLAQQLIAADDGGTAQSASLSTRIMPILFRAYSACWCRCLDPGRPRGGGGDGGLAASRSRGDGELSHPSGLEDEGDAEGGGAGEVSVGGESADDGAARHALDEDDLVSVALSESGGSDAGDDGYGEVVVIDEEELQAARDAASAAAAPQGARIGVSFQAASPPKRASALQSRRCMRHMRRWCLPQLEERWMLWFSPARALAPLLFLVSALIFSLMWLTLAVTLYDAIALRAHEGWKQPQ